MKTKIPFRYPGGKYYALNKLRPFWEAIEHDEYREPFVGGGAVFFAKPKVRYNWINDNHEELINIYKIMSDKKSRYRLIELFDKEIATKERHKIIKNKIPKDQFDKAHKYYYLNRTSYSGKMKNPSWGYREKRSLPPYRWKERLQPCGEKLENVKITCMDFEEVINAEPKGDTVLIFLDPPYYNAKQENHYVCSFNKRDHERLARCLRNTNYYFFLTYDNCDEVKNLYSWAYIYEVSFFYRLDNSNDNGKKRTKAVELVITNYKLEKEFPLV